jgi:hypothetical protein
MAVHAFATALRSVRAFRNAICFASVWLLACSGADEGGRDAAPGGTSSLAAGSGGSAAGSAASAGGSAPIVLDDRGEEELAGSEGITASVEDTTYTADLTAEVRDYGESYKYILIEAQGAKGTWTLGLPKKIGTHPCGSHTEIAGGEIAYILGPAGTGTAGPLANSACKVEVASFEDVVQGRFGGVLIGEAAEPLALEAGYFYISRE